MLCPKCENKSSFVVDSRTSGNYVRRRRECSKCHKRFTTIEVPAKEWKDLQTTVDELTEENKSNTALLQRAAKALRKIRGK